MVSALLRRELIEVPEMCRLYGFRANEPTKVECALVLAQNSLLAQSKQDHRGSDHSDGWGIAYYENGQPAVERRETAAWGDLRFSIAAERVFARTVLAHVRSATIGETTIENTHPYTLGAWSFAHNGTVAGFEQLEADMVEQTSARFLDLRQGSNDSEMAFYWMLTRLEEGGIELARGSTSTSELLEVFGQAVIRLARACAKVSPGKPARLNFILTDGRRMVASRWNRELHWLERLGVHDCEICGVPHIHHHEGARYRAFVLASEPITDEPWQELPQGSLIGVDSNLDVQLESFSV